MKPKGITSRAIDVGKMARGIQVAEVNQINDEEVREFLLKLCFRNYLVRRVGTHRTETKEQLVIEELNAELAPGKTGLYPDQMERFIKHRILPFDYYLDLRDSGVEVPDKIYLGHIVERKQAEIAGIQMNFFVCHSQQRRCFGIAFPNYFQPQNVAVYTNGATTWLEFKQPVTYKTSKDYPNILSDMTAFELEQLKLKGEQNYQRFPNKPFFEPGLN